MPVHRRCALILLISLASSAAELAPMLDLPGTGQDPDRIDFRNMPILQGEQAVVSHGNAPWPFRNHAYVTWFDGKFWCMWSQGLRQEDYPDQHVRYSVSTDGLLWSEAKIITGPSKRKDFRYIARGLWVHNGRLLAMASHDESYDETGKKKLFGPSLELLAFAWNPATKDWRPLGVVFKDAINNFPPHPMSNGEWMMIVRDHNFNLSSLRGGKESPLQWVSSPLQARTAIPNYLPDEPVLLTLPDKRVVALFRDNAKSKRIFRAVSSDDGRTWSSPQKTNFPDATSKFFPLRTSRGYYVLVSNASPAPLQRIPLCLSVSDDGITFTRMARLPIPTAPQDYLPREGERKAAGFQYPNVVEHDGKLLISYSRNMTTIEVVQISLDEVERLRQGMPVFGRDGWRAPVDPKLPNVLLLGDSISIGYTREVRHLLRGQANVLRPVRSDRDAPVNCTSTDQGLKSLSEWLGSVPWKVIHFNWGLHDLCYRHLDSKDPGHRDRILGKISVPPARRQTGVRLRAFTKCACTMKLRNPRRSAARNDVPFEVNFELQALTAIWHGQLAANSGLHNGSS